MAAISDFYGNASVRASLEQMAADDRVQQTLLLHGPEGVGKATLARRLAGLLLGADPRIEKDDLSNPENVAVLSEREKWPSEKRAEDPLLFASHPDFITFPPDGPLRQISIQQMRLLKERAQYRPLRGRYRVFLIDHLDRANEQAANSLLKILEEPPPYLVLLLTAANAYDLLPTIRSRSVTFHLAPLSEQEMRDFAQARALPDAGRRIALAGGCPGQVATIDLEAYDHRRAGMLALLNASAGLTPFSGWGRLTANIATRKDEKLEYYLRVLYLLLEDVVVLREFAGGDPPALRNPDLRPELSALAAKVSFEWLLAAVKKVDRLVQLVRRNIQKGIALDALVVELRAL
ncbi:MAG: AAA family ATPase [Bryobacterales bacterium]|nr:AAA family ATPase [Bryobacterales bacterium]